MDNLHLSSAKKNLPACFSVFDGTAYEVVMRIRMGIHASVVSDFAEAFDVRDSSFCRFLGIQEDSVKSRAESGLMLEVWESDRLYRAYKALLEVIAAYSTEEVICSYKIAAQWMTASIPALVHVEPLSLMDTASGYELVLQLINAIKCGVYM